MSAALCIFASTFLGQQCSSLRICRFTKGLALLGHTLSVVTQVLLVILHGLIIYIMAESFSLSGLMVCRRHKCPIEKKLLAHCDNVLFGQALFFYGIVVSHFNQYNMTVIARITLAQSLRVLSSASETYLYAYLGMTLTVMHDTHSWTLSLWTVVAIFVGRAVAIFPLSAVLNCFNRHCRRRSGLTGVTAPHRPITLKHQIMLWVAGLRGALSFGLSLDFPGERHPFVVSTTIFIVLLTIIGLGSATEPLLNCLKFSGPAGESDSGAQVDERTTLLSGSPDLTVNTRGVEMTEMAAVDDGEEPPVVASSHKVDDDERPGRCSKCVQIHVVWI